MRKWDEGHGTYLAGKAEIDEVDLEIGRAHV